MASILYLLDANVLITAHNLYYPVDKVPEFWAWLVHKGNAGDLKLPLENFEEIKDGSTDVEQDLLFAWINKRKSPKRFCWRKTLTQILWQT
jgi:hypothetical protein